GLTLANISQLHTVATDFVDLYPYESFVQTHLQTDYMHGRLTPSITAIMGLNGTFAVPVELSYRFSDSLLFDLKYTYLGGAFMFPAGFFRDRAQLAARGTVQLNWRARTGSYAVTRSGWRVESFGRRAPSATKNSPPTRPPSTVTAHQSSPIVT